MRRSLAFRILTLLILLAVPAVSVQAEEDPPGGVTINESSSSCNPLLTAHYFVFECEVWEIYTPCLRRLCIQRACSPGGDSEECIYYQY